MAFYRVREMCIMIVNGTLAGNNYDIELLTAYISETVRLRKKNAKNTNVIKLSYLPTIAIKDWGFYTSM